MTKVFKCALLKIEVLPNKGTCFSLKLEDGSIRDFKLNESPKRIQNRYGSIQKGERDTIYCSYGALGNLDICFKDDMALFIDSPHIYSFPKVDFEKHLKPAFLDSTKVTSESIKEKICQYKQVKKELNKLAQLIKEDCLELYTQITGVKEGDMYTTKDGREVKIEAIEVSVSGTVRVYTTQPLSPTTLLEIEELRSTKVKYLE